MLTIAKRALIAPFLFVFSLAIAQHAPPKIASHVSVSPLQTPTFNPAQGYYVGTLSNGNSIFAAVVESGEFWLIAQGGTPNILEFVAGIGEANTGTFTSNSASLLSPINLPIPYAFSAPYTPSIGMEGSLSAGSETAPVTFSATYDRRYETAYPIATVAGRYTGVIQTGNASQQLAMTIDADGALSATLATCTITGAVVQHSPAKNPYYVSIAFSGPRCDFGSNAATGLMTVFASPGRTGGLTLGIVGTDINREKFLHIYAAKELSTGAPLAPMAPSTPVAPYAPATPVAPATPATPTGGGVIDGGFLLE